jgi:hypothetical protein
MTTGPIIIALFEITEVEEILLSFIVSKNFHHHQNLPRIFKAEPE